MFANGAAVLGQSPPTDLRRTLILAIDGLSYESFQVARERGLFARFKNSGKHIAPYPSMSEPSWTEIWGGKTLFPQKGNMKTLEATSFDLDRLEVNRDPRNLFLRFSTPYNFMRAFDSFFNPFLETLLYFPGDSMADKELEDLEKSVTDSFIGNHHIAYLSSVDAIAHTQPGKLYPFLEKLSHLIDRIAQSYILEKKPTEIFLVSDHGNVGAFLEGEPNEPYLTSVTLEKVAVAAGLRIRPHNLENANDIAIPLMALGNYAPVYFKDLNRRRAFAVAALKEPFVSMVTYAEGPEKNRSVVVLSSDGEARVIVSSRQNYVAYVPVTGNPLKLDAQFHSPSFKSIRWITNSDALAATADTFYPDSLYRIAMTAVHQVENEPDLIVNLSRGYCFDGDFSRFVRMVRTHGGLDGASSLGLVASDSSAVPAHARSGQLLSLFKLTPEQVFHQVEGLQHHSPMVALRALENTTKRGIDSQIDDASSEMVFYRIAKGISATMDVISARDLKDALAAMDSGEEGPESFGRRVKELSAALQRIDFPQALKHVDQISALREPLLNEKEAKGFVNTLRDGLAKIPGFAAVTDINLETGTADSKPNAQAADALRRVVMKAYSAPFLLNEWLDLPESRFVGDPRDLIFATNWATSLRHEIHSHPGQLLKDKPLGSTLFREIFKERSMFHKLWPAPTPLFYNPVTQSTTVVFIPGTYNELFDQEIFARGLRSLRETLGARAIYADVDGRCSTEINAKALLTFLKQDSQQRIARGYALPRYLIVGYSKGAVDATELLLLEKAFTRSQILGLVSIASPHLGTSILEKFDLPTKLVSDFVIRPLPRECETQTAAKSLLPNARAAFWTKNMNALIGLTRYFSITLESNVENAHPWMKVSKAMARFGTPNDGIVPALSSKFPEPLLALDLGTFTGDHLAGIAASNFPQAALLDSIVLTLWETNALAPQNLARWHEAVAKESPLLLTEYHQRQIGKALFQSDLKSRGAIFDIIGPFPLSATAEANDIADSWFDTISKENSFRQFKINCRSDASLSRLGNELKTLLNGTDYEVSELELSCHQGQVYLKIFRYRPPAYKFWASEKLEWHPVNNLGELSDAILAHGLKSEKNLLEDQKILQALLPKSNRPVFSMPNSNIKWRADTFVDVQKFEEFIMPFSIDAMTPNNYPDGVKFICDHINFTDFRKEFGLFYESTSPVDTDNNHRFGYSQVAETLDGSPTAVGDLKSQGNSIRMTSLAYRFRPVDFPNFNLRVKIVKAVAGANPAKGGSGLDDSSLQIWYTLRNIREVSDRRNFNPEGEIKLFGYYWSDPNENGQSAAAGTLIENYYSKKNYVVATLPEARQIAFGGGKDSDGKWLDVRRNFAADVGSAFPKLNLNDWEVVAITFQTDSNDTKSSSQVRFRDLNHLPN